MKNKNILWIALFTTFLIGCSKTSENEITEIDMERPQGINMPYYGDVDFQLPIVPEYIGNEASAATRGQTIKVQPGTNQLQNIINNASAGTTIKLRPGSHIEDNTLVINHEVHLRGYDDASLILNGEMGLAIIEADDVSIKDLTITTTNNSVLGIGVEDSEDFEFKRNVMNEFLVAIVLEQAYKASITENTVVGIDQVDGLGIVAMNGERVSIRYNTVSGSAFGVWACDKNGRVYNNEFYNNWMGLILCKVPPGSFSPFFTIGNGGADFPCTEWKAKRNYSHDNVWGYVVIDGAKDNILSGNEAADNSFIDLELMDETFNLFAELTPGSFTNTVFAGELDYIDCGEDNKIYGGNELGLSCTD